MTQENALGLPVPGTTISFGHHKWKVVRQIYEGPFSHVYMLEDALDSRKTYAMKVEKQVGSQRPVLKLDVCVLSLLNGQPGFPRLISSGRTNHFKFCVMAYVGPELATLQALMPNNRFSPATTYKVALQTLDRIQALHRMGYLNRDLKAANFAVGLGYESNIVYMLDFGLTRRFKNRDGSLRPRRCWGPCVGTMPFAPIAAGFCKDQAAKDDMEGWFYMIIHMLKGYLPWHGATNEQFDHGTTREFKIHLQNSYRREFFDQLPKDFEIMYDLILNTRFDQEPPYRLVRTLIYNIIQQKQINIYVPYDWQSVPALIDVMKAAEYKAAAAPMTSHQIVTENFGNHSVASVMRPRAVEKKEQKAPSAPSLKMPTSVAPCSPTSNYAWDTKEQQETAVQSAVAPPSSLEMEEDMETQAAGVSPMPPSYQEAPPSPLPESIYAIDMMGNEAPESIMSQ